ncbi:aldolase/citrate lyase family protein [Niveispirillum sp.]|uniref:HpcH/HpaI aldolase family protein n=1 Tax=Niveispirillum sp. TaxID=1917217 RepID=UPI001B63C756|nr:aldolase/citrate lyase family protein [Niveispirillum sp.]MBP7339389.1 aldolase [Niveispirillum sp.]
MSSDAFPIRLKRGEPLTGCFCKIPSVQNIEVLAGSPLDCLVMDAEHGPFDRNSLDQALMILRALGKPAIVRPQAATPEHMLSALDSGADALLLPHIRTGAEAASVARWTRFGPGGRGFAGHTRSADLGRRPLARHFQQATESACAIAQIEDAEALEHLDAIAGTPGIDALFIGRIDLTISMGLLDPKAPAVLDACERICAAARRAGKQVGLFTPDLTELPHWRSLGASLFLLGSDQGFLQAGAAKLASDVAAAMS